MTVYIELNGYKISVGQESIFIDDYFRRRLVQEIYPAVQALQEYIRPAEFQSCLDTLANVKPNDKIKRLQKSGFSANRVPQRLDEFCKAILFQLEMWKRRCQESEAKFGKRNIELIIDEAWQSATHHIVGI